MRSECSHIDDAVPFPDGDTRTAGLTKCSKGKLGVVAGGVDEGSAMMHDGCVETTVVYVREAKLGHSRWRWRCLRATSKLIEAVSFQILHRSSNNSAP